MGNETGGSKKGKRTSSLPQYDLRPFQVQDDGWQRPAKTLAHAARGKAACGFHLASGTGSMVMDGVLICSFNWLCMLALDNLVIAKNSNPLCDTRVLLVFVQCLQKG